MVQSPGLKVVFYRTVSGREPVKEWLRKLERESKKRLGEDLKTVQLGWPLGMPLVRNLEGGILELRSRIREGQARVLFIAEEGHLILLNAFVKKSRKTPRRHLETAKRRAARVREQ